MYEHHGRSTSFAAVAVAALLLLASSGKYACGDTVQNDITVTPATKTVNLSPEVYEGRSVSSAAVAAHECGHAVQHANHYVPLVMRSKLVPAVQFTSMLVNWVLLIGVIMAMSGNPTVLLIGIILMSLTVIFTLVTLPVEFDASKRALAWLNQSNVTNHEEYPKAKDALKWAATTYVVAALAAVVTLIQYIMIYLGSRDR